MRQMSAVFVLRLTQGVSTVLFLEFLPAYPVRLLSFLTQELQHALVVLFRSQIVSIVQVQTTVNIVLKDMPSTTQFNVSLVQSYTPTVKIVLILSACLVWTGSIFKRITKFVSVWSGGLSRISVQL